MNNVVYIIIGGTGFLGKNFVSSLIKKNHEVIVIGRSNSYIKITNEVYYKSDQIQYLKTQYPLSNQEYILIDFAYTSTPNTSFEDPVKDFSENLYNVINHLEFAKHLNVKRYIYISSGGTIYGNLNEVLIREDSPNYPISPYGITKMACERYVNMYHTIYGLRTNIVRPSNIYGPGQKPFRGQGFISTALALAHQQKPISVFGDGSNIRDYLHVDDFYNALADVISHGENGEIYNIGSGEGYSINDLIVKINNVLTVDEMELKTTHSAERPFDVRSNILECSKLKSINNWKASVKLDEGISKTWNWIKYHMKTPHW